MKIVKIFDKITKVSEFVKIRSENCQKTINGFIPYIEDCDFYNPCRETEKAWCFDMGEDWSKYASKRYVYAPKSKCKLIENDYYIEKDGSFQKEKFVLVPRWIFKKW